AVPGLLVPAWLSYLLGIPYWALVLNVSIGQIAPAIVGAVIIRALEPKLRALPMMGLFK
ncbi:MAG: QueT transporter family protein, partial [Veillonella sp.]|nr:QueT transporter family protein [Veillonella sp.]